MVPRLGVSLPLGVVSLRLVSAVSGCSREELGAAPMEESVADDERGLSRRELLGKRLFEDESL